MARQRGRRGGGGGKSAVDWFCPGALATGVASLAAATSVTLFDEDFENPIDGAAYDAGAIVGLRMWLDLDTATAVVAAPYVVVMILPNGMTVPPVTTHGERKQAEGYIWFQGRMLPAQSPTSGVGHWAFLAVLGSSRRYPKNGRLVCVIRNEGIVPFGPTAKCAFTVDAYLREE